MPTETYTLIAQTTLAASASEVILGSLPQTYRDLVLVHSAKHTYAGTASVRDTGARFNSDTGTNYPRVNMYGTGSSPISETLSTAASIEIIYAMASANYFQLGIMQIMDYSATDKHKTVLYRTGDGNDSNFGAYASAQRWANTAAITSISITPSGSYQLLAGSTFALYGIAS